MTLHIISDKKRAALMAEMFETVAMPGDAIEKGYPSQGYSIGMNPASHKRRLKRGAKLAERGRAARLGGGDRAKALLEAEQHIVNARKLNDVGLVGGAKDQTAKARAAMRRARGSSSVTKMQTFEDIMKRKARVKSSYGVGKHPNSHKRNGRSFNDHEAVLVSAAADDAPRDLRRAHQAFLKGGATAAGVELDKRNLSTEEHGFKMRVLLATPSKVSRMTMDMALELSSKAPETILSMTPERRKRNVNLVREEIAGQIKKLGGAPLRQKRAHIIMGLPGAGKSALASMIQGKEKALLVDADEFKEKVAEFDNGIGANAVHRESSTMAVAMRRSVARTGANFIMPLVGSNPVKLKKSMDDLKAQGYKVILHHVDVPSLFAEQRVVQRFIDKNRAVPTSVARGPGDQNATRRSFDTLMKGGSAYGYAAYSAHNIPGAKIRYAVLGTKKYKLPKEG